MYICTQDNCSRLPPSDETDKDNGASTGNPDDTTTVETKSLDDTIDLTPWIAKAIKAGEYTPEQAEILKAQRRHVMEVVVLHENSFDSKDRPVQPKVKKIPASNDSATPLAFPIINVTPASASQPSKSWSSTRSSFIPPCTFKACHRCRPTYRERSYYNVTAVVAGEVRPFSEWHLSFRPTSDIKVVKQIGVYNQRPPLRRRTWGRRAVSETTTEDSDIGASELRRSIGSAASVEEDNEDEEQGKGFRATVKTNMKKAFKGLMSNRRLSQTESESSSSGISMNTEVGNRLPVLNEGMDEDAEEFDLGLWRKENDEILRDAAGVSLPGAQNGEEEDEDFGDGELEVEGGVAVTEEAVEMHAADIIMQV